MLTNTGFLQQSGSQCGTYVKCHCGESAPKIGSRLRDGTFKKCVAKCPGGGSRRRRGPPQQSTAHTEASRAEPSRAQRLLLCCRENKSPLVASHGSPQLVAPFFSPVPRGQPSPRCCVRVRVCVFSRGFDKKKPADCLPGVFLCPVITASPVTGCSQVVLLASSLLVEENGGKVNREPEKRQTGKMRRSSKQCVSIIHNIRVIFT